MKNRGVGRRGGGARRTKKKKKKRKKRKNEEKQEENRGERRSLFGNFPGGEPERIHPNGLLEIRFVVFMIIVKKETETREERSRERKR